jgi:hypothetical protein
MPETDYKAELDAVQSVLSILSRFDDSVREKILRTVGAFFTGDRPVADSGVVLPSSAQTFFEKRTMSPKQFLIEKQPQTDIERAACLAYFLIHYRDTPEFKTKDIVSLNTEAAQPKFTNPSVAIGNAVKAHLLVAAGGGKRQISAAGELYVEALPDRLAARAAIEGLARRSNRKRSTPRKKSSK